VFVVPDFLPSPNPHARFKWGARWGGEGNVERGGGKRKEKKRKGDIGKGGAALTLQKNS